MEQHRTRPQQHGPRRGTPSSLPPQGGRGGSGAARPARPSAPGPAARPARVGAPARGSAPVQHRPVTVRRPAPPVGKVARRLPAPRLTGLGGGLFCGAVLFLLGCLDQLLFDGSLTVYSVLFLPVCALTALWVRRGDVVSAPVIAPIAFTVGLLPVADGNGGIASRLMGLVTALATQAGWLYAGTLVAGLIATVRKIRLLNQRRRQRRAR
ncbi:DUF6542 domain-containing protein [Streptomyces sp. NPDC059582]|uniref:DUF6542 domain-containing protein n=1 Tax=Streptomyces sp. NPDC059582 TaxID=3346875 RepID=UPI0036C03D07